MRAMPGLIKDRHGTYYAQRKVPERLQEAVARVLNSEKPKQVFLKKSLGTKVFKEANVAATLVLAEFNRTLASAEALLKERPVIPSLSERVIPVHPQLVRLGFLEYANERKSEGEHAWLFPTVAPDQGRALAAWSKWWGRYLRTTVGIKNTDRVFHSFRHGVKDALRRGRVDVEAREALLGHSGSTSAVSRGYGASEMLERWGVQVLREAVATIEYVGLDLSKVRTASFPRLDTSSAKPLRSTKLTPGTKVTR